MKQGERKQSPPPQLENNSSPSLYKSTRALKDTSNCLLSNSLSLDHLAKRDCLVYQERIAHHSPHSTLLSGPHYPRPPPPPPLSPVKELMAPPLDPLLFFRSAQRSRNRRITRWKAIITTRAQLRSTGHQCQTPYYLCRSSFTGTMHESRPRKRTVASPQIDPLDVILVTGGYGNTIRFWA
ncbi:hypothetical protein PCASD_18196 [Puccinia coronata f. sp. avenae]|uniref:Uncharacterized protein n=1 Tax=Puccinia coronata f. sp. avenae TaxID=200324 RepID=A0A2N5T2B6_9BASI|nr:hypothetical protein PCASD_18196 [Puccinia coronata f. sp. avenae]